MANEETTLLADALSRFVQALAGGDRDAIGTAAVAVSKQAEACRLRDLMPERRCWGLEFAVVCARSIWWHLDREPAGPRRDGFSAALAGLEEVLEIELADLMREGGHVAAISR